MRKLSLILVPLLGAGLISCAPPADRQAAPAFDLTPEAAPAETLEVTFDGGLPADAMPEVPGGRGSWEECPYLDTAWVSDTNGQRTLGVGVDTRFDTPACVYWSYPEEPQLTVLVRESNVDSGAVNVVNWAAPVDSTSPAQLPGGWDGGRGTTDTGSVFAVQKGTAAVVVFSNQAQTVKPEKIAAQTIESLGL